MKIIDKIKNLKTWKKIVLLVVIILLIFCLISSFNTSVIDQDVDLTSITEDKKVVDGVSMSASIKDTLLYVGVLNMSYVDDNYTFKSYKGNISYYHESNSYNGKDLSNSGLCENVTINDHNYLVRVYSFDNIYKLSNADYNTIETYFDIFNKMNNPVINDIN